jgi:hypothetical protein
MRSPPPAGLLRIPGSATDPDTPQGFDKTIHPRGARHSESLQVAANFVVNVIYYGYEARRENGRWATQMNRGHMGGDGDLPVSRSVHR